MPTEISDWNDLDNVRNDLSGDYVLVNDLDSETDGYAGIGDDFEPIGFVSGNRTGDTFDGVLDGDGFQISDLVIEENDSDDGGVAFITQVALNGLVENLSVDGTVDSTIDDSFFGGLAGSVSSGSFGDEGTIQNCVSHVDVTAPNGTNVGGLVGRNFDTVTDSYATGSVEGDDIVGGLVGTNSETIETSYAVGLVTGNSRVGGLVGEDNDTVSSSYWDTEASGQDTSDGGTGLTTDEMQGSEAETNMGGFGFSSVWETVEEDDDDTTADGYPILIALDREDQLDAQEILLLTVDITGQITLDETGVDTADVIVFNLTNNEFGGKTETDTEGNYTLTVEGTEDGSGDTIAIAVDFADGLERYGRLITTVIE